MNEPGFTPGPWEVSSFRCSYVGVESTVASGCHGGNQSVTRCVVTTNSLPRAQAEANARLIAAAPELYEAVERALRYAQNIGVDDESSSYTNQLRAALSKARGHHD